MNKHKGCGSPISPNGRPNMIIIDDIDEDLENEENKRRFEEIKRNAARWFDLYFPNYSKSIPINTESWEKMKLGIYVRNGRK